MERANDADIILSLERLQVERLGEDDETVMMAFAVAEQNLESACEEVGVSFPDLPTVPEESLSSK